MGLGFKQGVFMISLLYIDRAHIALDAEQGRVFMGLRDLVAYERAASSLARLSLAKGACYE